MSDATVVENSRATALREIPSRELRGTIHFVVITIREDEFRAVLDRFPDADGIIRGKRHYNIRRLAIPGGPTYLVAICRCLEQGTGEAQGIARDAIEELDPSWLVICGIGGAVPSQEFTLGDVVVGSRILDFTVETVLQGKDSEFAVAGGPIHPKVAPFVANLAAVDDGSWATKKAIGRAKPSIDLNDPRRFYGDDDWNTRVREALEHSLKRPRDPLVTARVIASSDRLIKDTEIIKIWQKVARQCSVVEMEAAGANRAAHDNSKPLLTVRGISDVIGFKRDDDWTAYACHSAASFLLSFLRNRPLPGHGYGREPLIPSPGTASALASPLVAKLLTALMDELGQAPPRTPIQSPSVPPAERVLPPVDRDAVTRTDAVGKVQALIRSHSLLHVYGFSGSGRTTLVRTSVDSFDGAEITWLRCKGLSERECARRLDQVAGGDLANWVRTRSTALVVVMDDILPLAKEGPLTLRLRELVDLGVSRVRVVTIGVEALPRDLLEQVNTNLVAELEAPRLSSDETRETLRAHGAPNALLQRQKTMEFLHVLSAGVPALTNAIARYLESRAWRVNDDALDGLFKGAFRDGVRKEAVVRLVKEIDDAEARRLLYRLSIRADPWGLADVLQVAAVVPEIDRVRERMMLLSGLWLQQEAGERYVVSPLISNLGETELSRDELAECHRVVGRLLLSGRVNQYQFSIALGHLVRGEDFGQAAVACLAGLQQFLAAEDVPDDFGMLDLAVERVSTGVEPSLRALLYGFQAAARAKAGRPSEDVRSAARAFVDAIAGLEGVGEEEAAMLASATFAFGIHAEREYWDHIDFLHPRASRWFESGGRLLEEPASMMKSWLAYEVWRSVHRDLSPAGLSRWKRLVDELAPTVAREINKHDLADYGSAVLAELPFMAEEGRDDWERCLEDVLLLRQWAERRGLGKLRAWAIRTEQLVLVEKLADVDRALAVSTSYLGEFEPATVEGFVVREVVGVALAVAGRYLEARSWLDDSLLGEPEAVYPDRTLCVLAWASASARAAEDRGAVRRYSKRAVEIVERGGLADSVEGLKSRAERAQTLVLDGETASAVEATDLVLRQITQQAEWPDATKEVLVLFQVVIGNLAAATLRAEQHQKSFPIDLPQPRLGMFFTRNSSRLAAFSDETVPRVAVLLADAAVRVGRDEIADRWSNYVLREERAPESEDSRAWARLTEGLIRLYARDYTAAIAAVCDAASAMGLIRGRAPGDVATRAQIDEAVTAVVLIPAILRAASSSAADPMRPVADLDAVSDALASAAIGLGDFTLEALAIIAELRVSPVPRSELRARAKRLAGRDDGLWRAALLGVSMRPSEANLREVAAAQFQAVQASLPVLMKFPGLLTRVIEPCLREYWRSAIIDRGVSLSRPQQLRNEIEKSEGTSAAMRIEMLLEAVADAVSISRPPGGAWPR